MAYTTLMTTMDRLHRKGVLARTKHGRAFLYRPAVTRAEFESARATDPSAVQIKTPHATALTSDIANLLFDGITGHSHDIPAVSWLALDHPRNTTKHRVRRPAIILKGRPPLDVACCAREFGGRRGGLRQLLYQDRHALCKGAIPGRHGQASE